jgi:diaminopimelate epimerase
VKVNPAGNTTVIILDGLPRRLHPFVAARVMKATSLSAEQVGFLEAPTVRGAISRLQMMGGEFCGNAARGFAAWLVERGYPGIKKQQNDKVLEVPIEVSGHGGILRAHVELDEEGGYRFIKVPMPLPQATCREIYWGEGDGSLFLVRFEGIEHVVAWNITPKEETFRSICSIIEEREGQLPALGVMFFNEQTKTMVPVVSVREVGSVVWESSCASGTIALAEVYAHKKGRSIRGLEVKQPGGVLRVDADWDGILRRVFVSGDVRIEAEGCVYI